MAFVAGRNVGSYSRGLLKEVSRVPDKSQSKRTQHVLTQYVRTDAEEQEGIRFIGQRPLLGTTVRFQRRMRRMGWS